MTWYSGVSSAGSAAAPWGMSSGYGSRPGPSNSWSGTRSPERNGGSGSIRTSATSISRRISGRSGPWPARSSGSGHPAPRSAPCTTPAPTFAASMRASASSSLVPRGSELGRVVHASRYFTTMDPELRVLWDREIAGAGIPDEGLFEEYVERVLSGAGYRVIR